MKAKTPDKFERMALKKSSPDFAVHTEHVIKLLRRQHRAYVRMVHKYRNAIPAMRGSIDPDYLDGQADFANGIINVLTRYKR